MIDSDNVLLLRPARDGSAFALDGERGSRGGFVLAVVMPLDDASSFDGDAASILGSFVTEESENTFPSLPVREGERVFVCVRRLRGSRRRWTARPSATHMHAEVLRLEPNVEVVTRRMTRKEQR